MNKLAVITGASSGIGRATSIRLVQSGWVVIGVARRAAVLQTLADSLGPQFTPRACDGGDGEAVIQLAQTVLETHGVPDLLINCAGAGQWKEIEDTTPTDLNQMLSAPFKSAFHFTHAFMKPMLERGSGRVLHVNSPACVMPWAGSTGYSANRFALRGLNEALCADLKGSGVTSCNVILGEVTSSYFEANPDSHDKLPGIASLIPVMSPEACAKILERAAHKKSREVSAPLMLTLFLVAARIFPSFVRLCITSTQRAR